jgi:hypothetical protein
MKRRNVLYRVGEMDYIRQYEWTIYRQQEKGNTMTRFEVWTFMLAGLGLMGFIARGRRERDAA